MKNFKKRLSLLLAAITLLSVTTVFAGCATSNEQTGDESKASVTTATEETGEVDHRFDGVNFNTRDFRIDTSAHQASAARDSSNYLIEGEGKTGGGLVSDAVYQRNVTVEELLGVKLVFTQCELSYGAIAGDIRIYTQSGDDEFDLVINDNYDYAQLVIEGHFRNLLDEECVFDFDRNYWYKDVEDFRKLSKKYYLYK